MTNFKMITLALAGVLSLSAVPVVGLFADDKAADEAKLKAQGEDGFKSIFDGKELKDWDGNPKFWSVKDGAITGQTTAENPTDGNTFCIWKGGEVGDFELRLKYKIVGGNSGIQYRSKVLDQKGWRVGGYQADFEDGEGFTGILYDEGGVAGGRGIMSERGQKTTYAADGQKKSEALGKSKEELAKLFKKGDWNDYVVIAKGNHLTHKINGEVMTEVIDESDKALKTGILALQLHAGPPMTVQFKDIRIKMDGAGAAK